jgi:RND family efflux transporter MFP subunit
MSRLKNTKNRPAAVLGGMLVVRAAVAVFIALAALGGCRGGRGGDAVSSATWTPEKPSLAVEALRVSRGILREFIEAAGMTRGVNEAYLVAETQGIIQSVDFSLGDRVEAGRLLLKVDASLLRLQVEQAEQQAETVRIELEAQETLFSSGNTSLLNLTRAKSAAGSAASALERARKAYADAFLRSPITGYVAAKNEAAALGNLLTPGTWVARIVDISSLTLEVGVGEREVSLIAAGAPAYIRIPAVCEEELSGKVTAVAAGSDPLTGSYAVQVAWPNCEGERIRSGMSASVRIRTREDTPVVLIPTEAILRRQGEEAVITAVEGKAVLKTVETGAGVGNRTEIISGLEEGEILIITGLTTLADGEEVVPTIRGESGTWR